MMVKGCCRASHRCRVSRAGQGRALWLALLNAALLKPVLARFPALVESTGSRSASSRRAAPFQYSLARTCSALPPSLSQTGATWVKPQGERFIVRHAESGAERCDLHLISS